MGRRGKIFELLAGEDVQGYQMDLGVTVLASLRSGHVDNLAGAALDYDVAVLAQGRTLHGKGSRGPGIRRAEVDLVLFEAIKLAGISSLVLVKGRQMRATRTGWISVISLHGVGVCAGWYCCALGGVPEHLRKPWWSRS